MQWIDAALEQLSHRDHWGYRPGLPPAGEPVALVAIALASHGRHQEAASACDWLAKHQADDGGVAVLDDPLGPHWTTSLAILAWQTAAPFHGAHAPELVQRAARWLIDFEVHGLPQGGEIGHDPSLRGWPWIAGTHSWMEPTCLAVMALKAAGFTLHPRTREAVRMIQNRLLPTGGCNYGNTTVLGQLLRAHVQPSGLAMLALADEPADEPASDDRVARTLDYLAANLHADTTAASLSYGLLGLAAHGRDVQPALAWLPAAAANTQRRAAFIPRLALTLIAVRAVESPLITLTKTLSQP